MGAGRGPHLTPVARGSPTDSAAAACRALGPARAGAVPQGPPTRPPGLPPITWVPLLRPRPRRGPDVSLGGPAPSAPAHKNRLGAGGRLWYTRVHLRTTRDCPVGLYDVKT